MLPDEVTGEVTWSLQLLVESVFIRVRKPNIQFVVSAGTIEEEFLPYDPVAHRWWQIRDEASTLYLETSPDGVDWTTRLEVPHLFDLSTANLGMGVIVNEVVDDFEGPQFDDVNVPP